MPRPLIFSRIPVELSIVEFNLDAGENIFLTYTWPRRNGPHIQRTGKGPPFMHRIGGEPDEITAHPFGLRLGTWLIQEYMREAELEAAEKELEKAHRNGSPQADVEILAETVEELRTIRAHDAVFLEKYPGYEIIGQQGCGDLTMNLWNVAYINNDLGQSPPELVCLQQEPIENRTYSCLVKWKASEYGVVRFTIEEVRFRPKELIRELNDMVRVRYEDKWLPRGALIDFAVSNQRVIRDGQPVSALFHSYQFSDFRHLLQMPNLNPKEPLYLGETKASSGGYRPRDYFGVQQFGDIWFGEAELLTNENLQRAALSGPVFLPLNADERCLRGAMALAGYTEIENPQQPLAIGEWRLVRREPLTVLVEIYFKRNTYAWTMIGLSADNRRILCLVCQGKPGESGYVLEEAAHQLLQAGAHNALLMDEGGDVFQKVREDDGKLKDQVHRWRRRLRSTFIFSRRRYSLGCLSSPPIPDEPRMKVAKIELPPTVNLRGQMLHVRDQGNEGTCVGFAAAALREALDQHGIELSPRYLYHHCKQKDGRPEIEGTYLRTAMQMLKAQGICNEGYWPYTPRQVNEPKDSADTDAKGRTITDYIRLDDEDGEAMLTNLKYHLHKYGPFVAGVLAHEGWCKAEACKKQRTTSSYRKTGVIPDPTELEQRLGGHAICVVGYDDEHKRFTFKNSWGAEWGDEGYGYLSYDYMKRYCFEAWGIKAM